MQVRVIIKDNIWNEFLKLGEKDEMNRKTENALLDHNNRAKAYKSLLQMEGKAKWEGNLDELKGNRS